MCRLMVWTLNSGSRDPHKEGYRRGDVIDILHDNQFEGLEVIARDWFRMISVPTVAREQFTHLLEQEPWGLGVRRQRRIRSLDLDALEARARKAKRAQLDAMDEIVASPGAIAAATMVKPSATKRFTLR